MLKLITKAGDQGVDGTEIIALWDGCIEKANPKYKRIRQRLIDEEKIEKCGDKGGRGMRYRIRND